ncbi:MAG: hypothetical protein IPI14_13450 [Polaromonas sp.]|nr:hypothetical protein [Polaromonas sp.]
MKGAFFENTSTESKDLNYPKGLISGNINPIIKDAIDRNGDANYAKVVIDFLL